MKINVLQVSDTKIRPWCWWSDWVDVAVFNFADSGYLLQMQVSRRNAKRFKVRAFKGMLDVAHPDCQKVGDLAQMQAAT